MGYSVNDALEERRKRREEDGSSYDVETALKERRRRFAGNIRSNVDSKYLQSFFKDSENYVKSAPAQYDGIGYSTASQLYSGISATGSKLSERADNIRNYILANRENIDTDTYKALSDYLDNFAQNREQIDKVFRDADSFYKQFATEYDYNAYLLSADGSSVDDRRKAYADNVARVNELNRSLGGAFGFFSRFMTDDQIKKAYGETAQERFKEKDRLAAANRQYERKLKTGDDYYGVTEAPDFDENAAYREYRNPTKGDYSKYYATVNNPNISDSEYQSAVKNKPEIVDRLGLFMSATDRDRNAAVGGQVPEYDDVLLQGSFGSWSWLKKDEIDIYYYLLRHDGKESADKYLDDMKTELNRRETKGYTDYIHNEANGLEKLALNAASVPMSVLGGLPAIVDDAVNLVQGKDINPYSFGRVMQNVAQDTRSAISEDLNRVTQNAEFLGMTAGDVYQPLMSAADSRIGSLLSPVGYGVLMGMSAATSKARELYEKGASRQQIIVGGLLSGAAEMVFEKASIEHLVKMKDPKSVKQVVINALEQGGVEASEEVFTEIANTFSDVLVMGSQSDFAQSLQHYMDSGMSEKDASTQAFMDVVENVWKAGAGGFLSGGLLGGTTSIKGYKNYTDSVTPHGQSIIDKGGADDLMDLARKVTGAKLDGRLATDGKALAGLTEKTAKNPTARNVGALSDQLNDFRSAQNQADIKQALVEKGLSRREAGKVAEYLNSAVEGGEYTKEQVSEIMKNDAVMDVARDLAQNADSSVNLRNKAHTIGRLGLKVAEDGAVSLRNAPEQSERTDENTRKTSVKNAVQGEKSVSDDGETRVISTGKAVRIDGIAEIRTVKEDGKTVAVPQYRVTDADGGESVVSARDIEYGSASEGILYESFASLGLDPSYLNTFIGDAEAEGIDLSDAGQISRFALDYEQAVQYGMVGLEGELNNVELSDLSRAHAYASGMGQAKADIETAQKKIDQAISERKASGKGKAKSKGTVHIEQGKADSNMKRSGVEIAKRLASAGFDVYFYESHKNAAGQFVDDNGHAADNGYYLAGDGSIHIDLNAGNEGQGLIAFTMAHELVHAMRKDSPREFKILADKLVEWYGKKGENVGDMIRTRMSEENLSWADAYEEVIARSCESFLTDSDAVERLAELEQTDEETANVIRKWLRRFMNWVRSLYKGVDPESSEGILLHKWADEAEAIHDAFFGALKSAAEKQQWIGARSVEDVAAAQTGDGDETRYNRRSEEDSADGITVQDTEELQKIGRKSVNDFTGDDIRKAEKWARKFYRELGTKSPFFRAWFGDWRAYDKTKITVADTQGQNRGIVKNRDTNWDVQVSGKVFNETIAHKNQQNVSAQPYLPYINSIVKNAVLLDTVTIPTGKEKSANSAWMHTLYAVADMGKGKELLKLYVEELNDVNSDGTIRRAYQLQNIEKWQLSAKGSGKDSLASSISAANVESIADLYALVKSKDASFSSHPVNPALLNADGTPRVFYHGTRDSFTEFQLQDDPKFGRALGDGFYFTPNYDKAFKFANGIFSNGQDRGGIIMPVYLHMENPYVIQLDADRTKWMREYKAGDYDGIIDLKHETYYVENPTQIKSATDNIGTFDRTNPDIRYSRRGKTALETYTEKQYNAFGWASYGNVISPAEREILLSRYADFKHNRDQYPVTPWGEAVIHSVDCPDVILYVKGSIRCPEITRVVRINTSLDTITDDDVAFIREEILYNEGRGISEPYRTVEDYYEQGILSIGKARNHASFRSYQDAVRKGRSRQTGDTSGESLQDGGRSRAGGENGDRTDDGVKRRSTRDYSYKALTEKPDMPLTVLGGQIPGNRADIVALAKKNAAKVGKFDPYTGSVSVYVNDIDTDVILGTNGLKHSLDRRLSVNAPIILQAGAILKNSIQINELTPQKAEADRCYLLIGAATGEDGKLYIVRSVVNTFDHELTSMDVLYAMNAKRAEPAALNAPRSAAMPLSVTDSTQKDPAALNAPRVSTPRYQSSISIADLLDVVNRNFPDILPESVLRHFGHTERPGGDLGESALFSKRGTSNRALLVNALDSAVSSDIEQERLTQYRKNIDMLDAEQKKLAGLRAEIRTLSFAEGKRDKAALKALQDEATRTENRITNYDRRLLNLEATAPLKALLLRERTKARKAAEQRGKEALAEYRLKAQLDLSYAIQKNINARDSHARTVMRQKIRRVVSELNQLLLNGTKDRHVMIDWQKSTAEALAAVNMDTLSADSRLEALAQKIDEATDPAVREKLQATYARLEEQNDNMNQRLDALRKAYDGIKGSEDPLIQNAYHPEIDDRIKSLRDQVGDTPLRDMTKEQLQEVYDTYRMVLTTIRNANKAFKAARGESIAQLGEAVKREVLEAGGAKDKRAKLIKRFDRFYWDGMKPVYAFKAIGSKTLSGLFDNVRAGEDTWAVDVNEARNFFRESAKKHGYKSWNFDERYPFVSKSGKEFSLSLGQMLSLYAYSKREQAAPHLEEGGFVFDGNIEVVEKHKGIPVKYEINTADAYRLSRDTLAEIVGTLTDEQIAFVDDMQGYLSDTMAEKGNEVALAMYGVKLFGEKHYFPLKTAEQFQFESSSPAGEVRLRNAGFTQKTVDHATSPILLNDFMTVWGNHVNDMSMYHAFVLPIEDFNRVFNYAPYTQNADREAVKQYIENAYGKQPVQYIRRLLTDINGGARIDPTADLPNRMLGMFKKSAVFASASVVVQQPSAIARAFALVDPKYFATKPFSVKQHSAEWAEVKKYAPVAVIKEMGYFDTNMGKSTVDYITAAEYSGFKEKAAALIKDSGYRDEVLSKAPALADEITWCYIWNAVKKETAATTKLTAGSEEFLRACGSRFTEVIVNTQVYDSVLSRSAMMRSKDTLMKMITSFMAEPTTSLNMLTNAIADIAKGNTKDGARIIGAIVASVMLNSVLSSFVYAGRDDDEDKTWAEKYVKSLTAEMLDSLNPLTLLPIVKDVVSIFQGYDVERSDMAVVSDLYAAYKKLGNEKVSTWRKIEDFGGAVATLFGLPVKNIMRDLRAVYNTVQTLTNGQTQTGRGMLRAIEEALPGEDATDGEQLYFAILDGDKEHEERLRGNFKTPQLAETALRKALRDHDPRIRQAAKARDSGNLEEYKHIAKQIIAEGHFSQDTVVSAVNLAINELHKGESKTPEDKTEPIFRMKDVNLALENGDFDAAAMAIQDIIADKIAGGKSEKEAKQAIRSGLTAYWKPLYLQAYADNDSAEMARIRKTIAKAGIYVDKRGRSTVVETCQSWVKEQ